MINIADKQDNTPGANGELTAAEWNDRNQCIQEVVERSGQTLTGTKTPEQFSRAIFINSIAAQTFVNNSGDPNIITLTPKTGSSGLVTPDSYTLFEGAIVEFEKATGNTSSTVTINVGQTTGTLLGAKSLKLDDGSNPGVGEVVGRIRAIFDVSLDYWKIISIQKTSMVQNYLYNPIMDFWTRLDFFSLSSFVSVANNTITADRWQYVKLNSTGVNDVEQSTDTDTDNTKYSLKTTVTTASASPGADDFVGHRQKIIGYNAKLIKDKSVALRFKVKSNKTGTYCVAFQNGAEDRSYIAEYTIDSSGVWEQKTIKLQLNESTGTWTDDNTVGLQVILALAGGANTQTSANVWQTGDFRTTSNQTNFLDNTANEIFFNEIELYELGYGDDVKTIYDWDTEKEKLKAYLEVGKVDESRLTGNANSNYFNFITINFKAEKIKTPSITRANGVYREQTTFSSQSPSTGESASVQGFRADQNGINDIGLFVAFDWLADAEL